MHENSISLPRYKYTNINVRVYLLVMYVQCTYYKQFYKYNHHVIFITRGHEYFKVIIMVSTNPLYTIMRFTIKVYKIIMSV